MRNLINYPCWNFRDNLLLNPGLNPRTASLSHFMKSGDGGTGPSSAVAGFEEEGFEGCDEAGDARVGVPLAPRPVV